MVHHWRRRAGRVQTQGKNEEDPRLVAWFDGFALCVKGNIVVYSSKMHNYMSQILNAFKTKKRIAEIYV